MEKPSSRVRCLLLGAVACALACSFCLPTFGTSVKLTPEQKKAIQGFKALGPDSAALYKPDGTLARKGSPKDLESTFKACKDIQPISDSCWLCKDNGTILCSTSQKLKPDSSEWHFKPDSK
jgi:hypothetical protein